MFAPPPTGMIAPVHQSVEAGSPVVRISKHASFRHFGPLDFRFDHHVMDGAPGSYEARGIFYGAPSLECCIAEVFDDLGAVYLDTLVILPDLRRRLILLDVRGAAAAASGLPRDISDYPLRPPTQQWARFLYDNPNLYGAVDGILYTARHPRMDAYALFERCESALYSPGTPPYAYGLAHPSVRARVVDIANRRGLAVIDGAPSNR